MANLARINAANSERQLRHWDLAMELLRNATTSTSDPEEVANINMGIASILLARHAEEQERTESSDDGLNKADELLKASDHLIKSDEGKGILFLKRASVAQLRGDREQELKLLEQALPFLRRSNSRHIDTVEDALRRMTETGDGQ